MESLKRSLTLLLRLLGSTAKRRWKRSQPSKSIYRRSCPAVSSVSTVDSRASNSYTPSDTLNLNRRRHPPTAERHAPLTLRTDRSIPSPGLTETASLSLSAFLRGRFRHFALPELCHINPMRRSHTRSPFESLATLFCTTLTPLSLSVFFSFPEPLWSSSSSSYSSYSPCFCG